MKEIKATDTTKHIPVLMISARYNANNYTLDGIEADDFMAKPFNIDDLMDKIYALLKKGVN
ncbi:response regulator PleD [compost metagenome]